MCVCVCVCVWSSSISSYKPFFRNKIQSEEGGGGGGSLKLGKLSQNFHGLLSNTFQPGEKILSVSYTHRMNVTLLMSVNSNRKVSYLL